MFAIIDIETCGGSFNFKKGRIIEICIVRHDGLSVVDVYTTLINPECYISPYFTNISHIDNDMVRDAPEVPLREISFSGVNSENIFVANPISIAPEIIEIVGKQKQQATALMSISIYYKPELPMAGNNAYSQFVSGFGYKPIQTSVLLHVLDYKHKRIIEKAIMFESTDDKAQIEDLKTIHYIIANALTH